MQELPKQAHVAIIGAGIVGNSLAYHLAMLGWKDIVLLDKGPLPNPGGSTGHASNFIFPVDHSKAMTQVTLDSMEQYDRLGVRRESGGFELARTAEREEELKRRVASAKAWGIDACLVSRGEVKERFPWVNTDVIRRGFWSPTASVVDSLRAGTLMREAAQERGALSVYPNTELFELEVDGGRIRGLKTSRGEMKAEYVVIACGVWSPRIARMAGATIPLTPIVHQMIDVGPVSEFAHTQSEIEYPLIRDMSTDSYARQAGRNLEIGTYGHRPILHDPDDIPSIEEAKLSPTELPFTKEDFEQALNDAMELYPQLLDKDEVEIQYAVNGLISMAPDNGPVLGETLEVEGLWSAAAVWVKEGPGMGRLVAEWMTYGESEISKHEFDIARFYDYARTKTHVVRRGCEGFPKIYGIVHPHEQWTSTREIRVSPFYAREKELGAFFYETAGWERPHWYEHNRPLLEEFGDRVLRRPNEWDARWWSPLINAEHLALRERVAMIDLSAFAVFDVSGPGALDYMQRLAMAQMNVKVGKAVYTPLLDAYGGIKSDLTITRTGEQAFRVVTGGADGHRDKKWFLDNLPDDGSVQLHDRTSSFATLGLWGPQARKVLERTTTDDISHEGFPFASSKEIQIGCACVWALRISYVGELGWELHVPIEQGRHLWDTLWEAGQPFGIAPAGIGVYGTTARMEKGYRLYAHELEHEYTAVEAGLARPKVKRQDFIGKEAYLRHREEEPAAILCTLTVDDHAPSSGEPRFMLGHEPILTPDGERIVDRKGRGSYVTSAGSGPSVGKHLLMSYLPPEQAKEGTQLTVEYFGERYPVTVAVAGSTPLFDPENLRMRH